MVHGFDESGRYFRGVCHVGGGYLGFESAWKARREMNRDEGEVRSRESGAKETVPSKEILLYAGK